MTSPAHHGIVAALGFAIAAALFAGGWMLVDRGRRRKARRRRGI